MLYLTNPIRPEAPRADVHQIWHSCRGRWLYHMWQIFWRWVKGCRFCRGWKSPCPID